MRVLENSEIYVVSEFVDAKRNSTGYYWQNIIKGLLDNGANVHVISTAVSCKNAKQNGVDAMYYPIKAIYEKRNLISRIKGQLKLSLFFLFSILHKVRAKNIVFSGTNPPFLILFIAILQIVIRFRWILLVHDVFPENLIPAGLISKNAFLYKIIKWVFDRAYGRAHLIVSIGRDMCHILESKITHTERIKYIPNFVDLQFVINPDTFNNDTHKNVILFQFFGNMGRVQGIKGLLDAIKLVKNKNAKFLFMGNGVDAHYVEKQLDNSGNVIKKKGLSFERNNEGLFIGDIAIISLVPGMYGLGVPSKAYFSLAANKKILVIGDEGCELHLLLKENPDLGWFCPAGNIELIAATIDTISTSFSKHECSFSRKLIEKEYASSKIIPKYWKLLQELQ